MSSEASASLDQPRSRGHRYRSAQHGRPLRPQQPLEQPGRLWRQGSARAARRPAVARRRGRLTDQRAAAADPRAAFQRRGQAQRQPEAAGGQPGRHLHGHRPGLSRLALAEDLPQLARDVRDQAGAGMHRCREEVVPALGPGGRLLQSLPAGHQQFRELPHLLHAQLQVPAAGGQVHQV